MVATPALSTKYGNESRTIPSQVRTQSLPSVRVMMVATGRVSARKNRSAVAATTSGLAAVGQVDPCWATKQEIATALAMLQTLNSLCYGFMWLPGPGMDWASVETAPTITA